MPNDGQIPEGAPQAQPQPVAPTPDVGAPAGPAPVASALESEAGELEDPDFDMGVQFLENPNNPELHGTPELGVQGDEPAANPQGQAPAGVDPNAQPQGVVPSVPAAPVAAVPPVAPVQPTAQPQTQPAATPQAPVGNPSDVFAHLHSQIEQRKGEIVGAVASQTYQLTQQELEGIQTEPEKVLPTLMARVHLNAVQGVLRHVAQQLPTAVGAMIQAHENHRRLEDKFYGAWPQLDRTAHDGTVRQMAAMYRAMNPNASLEDMIQTVGAQVVTALRLPLQAAPTQPVHRQPVAQPRPQPYVPAGPALSSTPAPARVPGEWERMASYIALDDAGMIPGG
jgi:hypothetical protein